MMRANYNNEEGSDVSPLNDFDSFLDLENFWIYQEEKEENAQSVPVSTLDLNRMPDRKSVV